MVLFGRWPYRVLMRVRTSRTLRVPIEMLWTMLCDSRMTQEPRSPLFRLGLPRPVECRLPDGSGGVGHSRECKAANGSVHQRITVWEPPHRLEFRMERTNLVHRWFFDSVVEEFKLVAVDESATRVTRVTTGRIKPWFYLLCPFFKVGLREVHRFVFRNWAAA